MNKNAKAFIEEFGGQQFPHCERLFGGIGDGSVSFKSSLLNGAPVSDLLPIYQTRLKWAQSEFDEGLASDTGSFVTALADFPDGSCEMWSFDEKGVARYRVFVESTARKVLGCLRLPPAV